MYLRTGVKWTLNYLTTSRIRWVRCLWSWISTSPTTDLEVDLTLVFMDTYITHMIHLTPGLLDSVYSEVRYLWWLISTRQYRTDYNNRPSNSISFIPPIPSSSGSLHSEFVCILFLQTHRETDHFFEVSGVHLPEPDRDQFHYHRTVFSSHLKSKVDNILVKSASLWITLNIDGEPIVSKSHSRMCKDIVNG